MKQPMTKIEEDKIKWIEKIETVYPETIQLPNYQYWNSQNTLDYNISLRNKPVIESWWKLYIWYFTFNSTWNKVITWVWFKPKLVRFTYNNSWQTWMWSWAMTETYQFAYDINGKLNIQTECIQIRDAWLTAIWRASYVSMNTDWFTINVTRASTTINVNYECYW